MVGGYDDDLKKSVEYFVDGAWEDHPAELEFGRWAYGMPNYIPQDMVRGGGEEAKYCSELHGEGGEGPKIVLNYIVKGGGGRPNIVLNYMVKGGGTKYCSKFSD